jgi:hypothetical protein
MQKRIFVIALLVLALAAVGFAADDPFTGTWRMVPPSLGNGAPQQQVPQQLIVSPMEGGISIQRSSEKPIAGKYGQDLAIADGSTINIVRVDDHNIKNTISQNGKITGTQTGSVSPDGKRYSWIWERVGGGKTTLGYDRVGPVPAGDAFFGTWQVVLSNPRPEQSGPSTYTLIVDGETFDWSIGDRHTVTAKFDGKEYKRDNGTFTMQLKRIDDHTIEIVQKPSNDKAKELFNGRELKDLWQVNGNTLIVTGTRQSPDNVQSKSVVEFERIK